MSNDYIPEWHDPLPPPIRRTYARITMRDGAWPEFGRQGVPHTPRSPLTPEQQAERKKKQNAQALAYYHANKAKIAPSARARAKKQYDAMTPEQKAARVTAQMADMRAHPEKKRQYNATYNAKHPKHYKKHPRAGHGPDGRFLPGHTQQ